MFEGQQSNLTNRYNLQTEKNKQNKQIHNFIKLY
jgi:hypothetical protein